MTIPKIRRRTYAPKTRTGCVTCKQRRVKCDEQKPTCVRCQARKLECQYDALPKPWIFESSKSPASSSSSPVIPELHMIARPQAPLNTFCGTPEEQRAVDFYMVKTGPWLANYGPHSHRELWEAVFPRVAANLPATRHLLVAVALLETPAGTQDPATLKTRSQIIMRNYTKALHELTSPGTHYADSGLAPILGWLLESLSWNEARASMHSAGAQHTLEANESMIRFQSKDEFIFDEKMRFILYNIRRFRCMRCKVKRPLQEDTQIFLAVAMRNTPFQPANTKDVREAFQVFVKSYNPPIMTAKDIHEAQEFARRWEFAVVRSRHTSHEPPIIFNALHFLSNVVTLLLPIPVVNKIAGDDTVGIGVDYITDQCYWLLKPLDRNKDTKEALVEIVTMILQLLSRWAPDAERRSRAAERLTELMETGDINKVP